MSKKVLAKSKLNKKENVDKKISVYDIDLNNVTIDDLELGNANYNQFINLKNLLDGVSSCQLSDAYNNLYRKTGVVKGLKSVNNNTVYGRIMTAETNCDDWGTSVSAINACDNGNVLFVKSSSEDLAIWGELASVNAKNSDVAGVAIYGSVRDMDALLNLDYPIFSCNFTPNAGKAIGLGVIGEDIVVDEEVISPGDFFFGDETGAVVIPQVLFTQVINEVLSVKLMELDIIEQLNDGKSLMEITGISSNFDSL